MNTLRQYFIKLNCTIDIQSPTTFNKSNNQQQQSNDNASKQFTSQMKKSTNPSKKPTTTKCKTDKQYATHKDKSHNLKGNSSSKETNVPASHPPTVGSITSKPIIVLADKTFKQYKKFLKNKMKQNHKEAIAFQQLLQQAQCNLDDLRKDVDWKILWDPDLCIVANREHFGSKICLFENCNKKESHFHCGICHCSSQVRGRGQEFERIIAHMLGVHIDPHVTRINRKINLFANASSKSDYDYNKLSLFVTKVEP